MKLKLWMAILSDIKFIVFAQSDVPTCPSVVKKERMKNVDKKGPSPSDGSGDYGTDN